MALPDDTYIMATTLMILIVGMFVGSFVNVLIDRLPRGEDIVWGRSRCDHCGRNLTPGELVPVISFVLLGARSACCSRKLSLQYPVVEIATGICFAVLWSFISPLSPLVIIFAFVLLTAGIALLGADVKYQVLPDSLMAVSLVSTAVLLTLLGDWSVGRIVSASVSAAFFFGLWAFTKGKGMGFGDVKVAFVLGLLLGYPLIIISLYLAFLTGAAVGVILMIVGHKTLKSKIAFGPFLITGAIATLVWGNVIFSWWRRLVW